jgi:DNA-binding NarL/FixJ family response regulator
VSLNLSSADVERLEAALAVLLSPLAFESLDRWRTAARTLVEPLVGADKSTFMLPLAGETFIQCEDADVAAYESYRAHYIQLDTGFHVRRRELGLEVNNGWDLYDPVELMRSELYNDWASPSRMFEPMGITVELPPSAYPAALLFYRERPGAPAAYEREMGILRLLLPAFKAGIKTCCQLARYRQTLAALLDSLPGALAVFDASGRLLHENQACTRLLAHEPEAPRVRAELACTAGLVAAVVRRTQSKGRLPVVAGPARREVRTRRARYRVSGNHVGEDLLPPPGAVIVSIEIPNAEPFTPVDIAVRYGFTSRESQVAQLMGEGRSNAQVAQALGFTIHSARRHAERILAKLELHSRAEVAARLHSDPVLPDVNASR